MHHHTFSISLLGGICHELIPIVSVVIKPALCFMTLLFQQCATKWISHIRTHTYLILCTDCSIHTKILKKCNTSSIDTMTTNHIKKHTKNVLFNCVRGRYFLILAWRHYTSFFLFFIVFQVFAMSVCMRYMTLYLHTNSNTYVKIKRWKVATS